MAAVFASFRRKPSDEDIKRAWVEFSGPAQELGLPSAPKQFIHYFEPVSYTHLDVYKRQVLLPRLLDSACISGKNEHPQHIRNRGSDCLKTCSAVSYTHLVQSRMAAVLAAFIINYAAYFSEIYRGGIESIPKGQYEAGQVLGMTDRQIFFRVVLLQVIKRIVPPMGNEIITLVKDTSLARVIAVGELIRCLLYTSRCV